MSSVKSFTEVISIDLFVMVVDTAVTVVTSNLGMLAGGLELAATSWKDYNLETSMSRITTCMTTGIGSIAYFIVYLEPEELEISGPGIIAWKAMGVFEMYMQFYMWKRELH